MKRSLKELDQSRYDLAIVGGGIYGACIAWDAALRGLSVCLIEKSDFASATSANSLKIIHGGFRHIQQANLKAMRQLINERQTWIRIAPHLIHPLPVIVPAYGRLMQGLLSAAILVYNTLSAGCDTLNGFGKSFPKATLLSAGECLDFLPDLPKETLSGGALFYDAQVHNTERLVLDFLHSAASAGAVLANYVEATKLLTSAGRVVGVKAEDRITGDPFDIQATAVIAACGPWTSWGWPRSGSETYSAAHGYAKAINVVTRRLNTRHAFAVPAANGYRSPIGRSGQKESFLFVAPWRDCSLVGTSYASYHGDAENFTATYDDVQRLLSEINRSWPAADLKPEEVRRIHCGLLPTTRASQTRSVQLLTGYEILDGRRQGRKGFYTVTSTKYTTARLVAEKAVDQIFQRNGHTPPQCRTSSIPVQGGDIENFDLFVLSEAAKQPYGLTETATRRLLRNYGSSYSNVLQYLNGPDDRLPSNEHLAMLRAETVHGIREEMACTLRDIVLRRTDLGSAGHPGAETLGACASVMATELGWSAEKTQAQIAQAQQMFRIGA